MHPLLHPRLINSPFGDPGLLVNLFFEKRAMLFDAGEIGPLSTREILKTSHVFISHTHMDHFIGFDRLLRLYLGRDKILHVYGPEGFLTHLEGKLAGYSWNLVEHYDTRLILHATEVRPDCLISRQYPCNNKFIPGRPETRQAFDGILLKEPALRVSAVILDHGIPCLGFSLEERFHVNIMKDKVMQLGLEIGPWLRNFKQALYRETDPSSEFTVSNKVGTPSHRSFALKELADRIAVITPGQKVTYITDTGGDPSNLKQIIEFAAGSDHLFIEAAFLDEDRHIAREKYHLTALQAGTIAREANVRELTVFHFSPRYTGQGERLEQEARAAWMGE